MSEISIHDNIVTGYAVFCERGEVVLHTEFRGQEPNEKTDVIFSGVEAYHISRDNMRSILFDVEECPIEHILDDFSCEFDSGAEYCWPGPWNESLRASQEHLHEKKCRGWIIHSSYGLRGFVIAKTMELVKLS